MYNYFISNRELVKNLAINTGTTANPVYTGICTTSEVNISTELESKGEWRPDGPWRVPLLMSN